MKFHKGDAIVHKYDKFRIQYMGIGYLIKLEWAQSKKFVIKFAKLRGLSGYSRKSMYNLDIYTDIFREFNE